MKSYRHIIAVIFLALFCLTELADIHVFTHDAGDTDCQLCVLAFENQSNDGFLGTEIVEVPTIILIPADVVRTSYEKHYFDSQLNYSLQNKAPPAA